MATFDEVLRELRGGVQVATRWKDNACIQVGRNHTGSHFAFVTKDGQHGVWTPFTEDILAENWVIYPSLDYWTELDWSKQ